MSMARVERPAPPPLSTDWRRPAVVSLAVIGVFFGIGGGWAAIAPLDSAVHASGTLAVESQRKAVQHFEGGIISQILVRDGDVVQEGQTLFTLDDTQPRATLEIVRNQLAAAQALEARLVAERDKANAIEFPPSVTERAGSAVVRQAIDDQIASFQQRRANNQAQIEVALARIRQMEQEIKGLTQDRESSERQIQLLDDQLQGLRVLFSKQLVSVSRVKELERERERISGLRARSASDISKAQQLISETELQIRQLEEQFQQSVGEALVDVRKGIAESQQRVSVATDILRRLDVKAPQTGVAQGRKFSTLGAVVKPGDILVEIAPLREKLVVGAKVSPFDIDSVVVGQQAEIRFPSFPMRKMPMIYGKVRSRSNDVIMEQGQNAQPFYHAEVEIDADQIPAEAREKLVAGMPASIIVTRGPRTPLEYLIEPISDRLRLVMREK